ncbi:MAG: hypothetical protein V2A54_01665 [Bacteroidota bacterium]
MVRKLLIISSVLLIILLVFNTSSCKHDVVVPDHVVCFKTEVQPVFINHCAMPGCHSASASGDDVDPYDTYEHIMKGIEPGNPSESECYNAFEHHKEGSLSSENKPSSYEKAIVKMWIEQRAVNDTTCH